MATDAFAEDGVKELLRLTTAGSVDDGKSTLIGRLLADCGALAGDQLAALREAARRAGRAEIDYARITDGLSAEREQGITIDVAYRYFSTERRKFILADVPGHEQYTRNMVTGASNAAAAMLLIDVRHGMTRQTRRHALVASLMGLRHAIFAVNKMDLVGYAEEAFARVRDAITRFSARLAFSEIHLVPVSARLGDNVVRRSDEMPWYRGPTVLELLHDIPAAAPTADLPFRMPVQLASRPQGDAAPDFRGYMGRVASGTVRIGDAVRIAPGPQTSTVTEIHAPSGPIEAAGAGRSVTVVLADAVDAGRGFMLGAADAPPRANRTARALVAWLDEAPQNPRNTYLVRIGTRLTEARLHAPERHLDIDGAEVVSETRPLEANALGILDIAFRQPVAFDSFADNPATGAFVVIDPRTNGTVAAGMIDHGP